MTTTAEEITIDPRTTNRDLRMLQTAIKNGWEINPRALQAIPDQMIKLALTSEDHRVRVNAARVLVAMAGQNRPAGGTQVNVQVNNQFDEDFYSR